VNGTTFVDATIAVSQPFRRKPPPPRWARWSARRAIVVGREHRQGTGIRREDLK